jgi:hypothetical protein
MAGSRKTVAYTADDGDVYCISVDESNIELIMGASVPASGAYPALPKGTTPRFVRVESELGLAKRKIPVLTLARYTALDGATPLTLGAGDIDSGTAVRVRNKVGEKNRFIPRDYDTAKLDGDST